MSNCVEVRGSVFIPFGNINLWDFMQRVKQSDAATNIDWYYNHNLDKTDDEIIQYFFYWFMNSQNVGYDNKKERVFINLGEARSTHTFRDLRGIVHVLSKFFVTKPFSVRVKIRDIDAPSKWGWCTLVFDKDSKENLIF